jgi:hypothetical protein
MGNKNTVIIQNYQLENNKVYYISNTYLDNRIKLDLNRKSFLYLGDNHCKDKNRIFYKNRLINADYLSWKYLINNYSKDISKVYYKGRVIEEADAKTFTSKVKSRNNYGFDKNYNYFHGKSIRSINKIYQTKNSLEGL